MWVEKQLVGILDLIKWIEIELLYDLIFIRRQILNCLFLQEENEDTANDSETRFKELERHGAKLMIFYPR